MGSYWVITHFMTYSPTTLFLELWGVVVKNNKPFKIKTNLDKIETGLMFCSEISSSFPSSSHLQGEKKWREYSRAHLLLADLWLLQGVCRWEHSLRRFSSLLVSLDMGDSGHIVSFPPLFLDPKCRQATLTCVYWFSGGYRRWDFSSLRDVSSQRALNVASVASQELQTFPKDDSYHQKLSV